ncbi:SAM-dependent methyltransferase [Desulfuromonas versatilis]|uniref:SAM-dependent methyltransferase n=1 Tax=Desulfuromonas versatilis TaxID=2802975 RepID=A0ABN6E201_9BACT|nr:50S ribosomal protein L11 methyltransferase [Desulfuromonas versatilis]BCR05524.1 SAM-dependent methyltransferase [Desulfuromonas versatilis]
MGREFRPFDIGRRFRVLPEKSPISSIDRLDLIMAAGAFGSGEHETTASCLELLETLPAVSGANLLDLGSGTGILSIAALKLGAGQAVCVDIDPAAIATCRKNCELNRVSDRVSHIQGTLTDVPQNGFDMILANIYGDILLEVAEQLVAKARPGASLVLSGILWEYNFDVRQRYERLGCEVLKNRMLEEFSSVLLQKR